MQETLTLMYINVAINVALMHINKITENCDKNTLNDIDRTNNSYKFSIINKWIGTQKQHSILNLTIFKYWICLNNVHTLCYEI